MLNLNVEFRQVDPAAKQDSTPSASNQQAWSNVALFKRDDFNPSMLIRAMTLEHNQAILDGTMQEFPDNPAVYNWGLVTLMQSNTSGVFATPPTVDITFGSVHKSPGLSIFNHPWPQSNYVSSVRITWRANDLTTIVKSGTYSLTGFVGVINEAVDDFRRITIELLTTNIPRRYAKIWNIEYGLIRLFENEDIDTANLLEEVDPISDIISINTFGFSIRTHTPEFSPISGDVSDDMMMKRQSMTVTAGDKPLGTFFLDTWSNRSSNGTIFDFHTIDAIGAMDGYRFMGDIYNNILASTVISHLFTLCFPTGLIGFQFESVFADMRISGHIPICTAREALQQICFAIGAVADTSRRNYVWIYKRDTDVTYNIPRSKIYLNDSNNVEPSQYFSGIDLSAYEYKAIAETQEIHNGELPIGQHTFEFAEPFHSLIITGATLSAKSANYATINVNAAGIVTLTGNRYIKTERIHSKRVDVAAGQQGNVCKFSDATLVDNTKAPALVNDLWAYISQRIILNNEMRHDDLEVGYVAEIETYKRPIVGTIERLDTNLRGERTNARIVGNVRTD